MGFSIKKGTDGKVKMSGKVPVDPNLDKYTDLVKTFEASEENEINYNKLPVEPRPPRRENNNLLLCSFVTNSPFSVARTINDIKKNFEVPNGMVMVYTTKEDPKLVFLVYNVVNKKDVDFRRKMRDTISVKRHKETNTLFSVPAVKEMSKTEDQSRKTNRGFVEITWKNYEKSIVITRRNKEGKDELKVYQTELKDVRNI